MELLCTYSYKPPACVCTCVRCRVLRTSRFIAMYTTFMVPPSPPTTPLNSSVSIFHVSTVFPVAYKAFCKLWNVCCLAACPLNPPLRCYIHQTLYHIPHWYSGLVRCPKTVITTCQTGHGQTRNFQPKSELSMKWLLCRTFTFDAVI